MIALRSTTGAAALLLLLHPSLLPAVTLSEETEAFLNVNAVAGREAPAADFIQGRLAGLPVQRDALGNVVLTVGSGEPRRLAACALGEPGFIVSGIREDGYLRVVPAGADLTGALWAQGFQGQTVTIGGSRGWMPGAVALPSVHLQQRVASPPDHPFQVEDLYIDVGAENAGEVAALGIRLMDPVALIRRPMHLAGDLLAAPAAAQKGACSALVDTARRYSPQPGSGTVVFAWLAHDLLNRAGLIHVIRSKGPFRDIILLDLGFGWEGSRNDGSLAPKPLPAPGSGPVRSGDLPPALASLASAPHYAAAGGLAGSPDLKGAQVGFLGLPARYLGTPVETIAVRDVGALSAALHSALGGPASPAASGPALSSPPAIVEAGEGYEAPAAVLRDLIARYGVSGAEAPVREEILRHLPAAAKPEIDAQGNVIVTVGKAARDQKPILFVAHQDEVGFRVAEVLVDGRLRLERRGGVLPSVWEAQAALVHGDRGATPAVFEPREDWRKAEHFAPPGALTAYLGVASAREAEALGVHAGSTVTMPKRMFRLGRHRVLARSFDDRVGATALILALERIDPAKLKRQVIFAWSVGEEVGLDGAKVLAERFKDLAEVHAVDTFVSSDSPIESKRFADARLGSGAVLRAMDNGYLAPRELIDRFLGLASHRKIPVQVGFTGGATDGMAFLANGPAMLPFSWPGRYSHSPVEVADLRDLEALVDLIVAAATE
ncbi:MAG TPA: M20/M25/M40 family metallo-hydrolase [Thermoanaerobaculia bacterium]|nr:M20/M25/M40 family metallo-hydrolase [Thermoanaerobaculia bacterium]